MKKPCINCQESCNIWQFELGDFSTLVYLRICKPECLFEVAHKFLYSINKHKEFMNHLYDLQDPEDKTQRDTDLDYSVKESLRTMREFFEQDPDILAQPTANLLNIFSGVPISLNSGETMKFTRYKCTKEDRLKWKKYYIAELNQRLFEANEELLKIEAE